MYDNATPGSKQKPLRLRIIHYQPIPPIIADLFIVYIGHAVISDTSSMLNGNMRTSISPDLQYSIIKKSSMAVLAFATQEQLPALSYRVPTNILEHG